MAAPPGEAAAPPAAATRKILLLKAGIFNHLDPAEYRREGADPVCPSNL
jgi:hypothetical protein